MQLLQNAIRAIKYFQHGQATESQKTIERGDWMKASNCVECGGHVPAYLNFLCEDCWREALNAKLEAEDAAEFIEQAKRNPK
jgi:hypothetical protein